MKKYSEEYREGLEAAISGIDISENPYREVIINEWFEDWINGFESYLGDSR